MVLRERVAFCEQWGLGKGHLGPEEPAKVGNGLGVCWESFLESCLKASFSSPISDKSLEGKAMNFF